MTSNTRKSTPQVVGENCIVMLGGKNLLIDRPHALCFVQLHVWTETAIASDRYDR